MMTHHQALEVVARHRGERIVLTTMGSVGVWPAISDAPLDFHYIPSSMGQGPPLGLGLALLFGGCYLCCFFYVHALQSGRKQVAASF